MSKRRSLDDTCDIFLSRRRIHSPLSCQRAASEHPHCPPTLCADNITVPPYFLLTGTLELPAPSATAPIRRSTKILPAPGSSGVVQPKAMRLVNGRCHVPRPRNPFILFRCDFVHQRRTMPRSDLDDTNISRIAGDMWREMTAAEKRPWVELAAKEKAQHAKLYPNYKYAPTHAGPKTKRTKNDVEDHPAHQVSRMGSPADQSRSYRQAERPRPYPQPITRRRSSSCPPVGAAPVPSHSPMDEWSPTRVTQDDMQRGPSRTVMYHSVVQESAVEPTAPAPAPAAYNPVVPLHGFDWFSLPQFDPSLMDPAYPLPDLNQNPDSYPAPNLGFLDNKPVRAPFFDVAP